MRVDPGDIDPAAFHRLAQGFERRALELRY
jgi:hypothetical protein